MATGLLLIGPGLRGDAASSPPREALEREGAERIPGRLTGDPQRGFEFVPEGAGRPIALEPGMTVRFEGAGPPPAAGLPPFRIDLGLGQQISGRLASLDARELVLTDSVGGGNVSVDRSGALALVQRPGESVVFQEGFESLDTTRWGIAGEPEVVKVPRLSGSHSLKVPAGGSSLTHRLVEPFGSGRLEVAFHNVGATVSGQKWFVDLTFRGATGPETVRAVLGWSEESLAVESPSGPALAVQRLARAPGWHRLSVRFGPGRCEVAVDGNELAHGKGFGGPLVEVRLASYNATTDDPPDDLAGSFDDLRLVRFAEPAGDLEVDATQDEVRLAGGDQVFGSVRAADQDRVSAAIDGKDVQFPWGEVSGVFFRRVAAPGKPVSGWLVRAEWRSAPGNDPKDIDQVEGALTAVSPKKLTVATPYAGILNIPLDRLKTLRFLGRGVRIVIDPVAHHLGDEISNMPPLLDPPQPEGGVLERSVTLESVPKGAAFLALDVVQVVGQGNDLPFSNLVNKGELRTNVSINGTPFDYLNRYINSRNETPERIRLPIPSKLLKPGKNVIRFDQVGIASDPNYLDDLGILGIALEFDPETGPQGGK
jgi:hypothetical protein